MPPSYCCLLISIIHFTLHDYTDKWAHWTFQSNTREVSGKSGWWLPHQLGSKTWHHPDGLQGFTTSLHQALTVFPGFLAAHASAHWCRAVAFFAGWAANWAGGRRSGPDNTDPPDIKRESVQRSRSQHCNSTRASEATLWPNTSIIIIVIVNKSLNSCGSHH